MPTAFPVTVTSLVPKACFFTFAPPLAPSKCERASQQTASWGQAVSAHCCPGPLTRQALGPGHWLLPPPQPPLRSGTGPFSRRCADAVHTHNFPVSSVSYSRLPLSPGPAEGMESADTQGPSVTWCSPATSVLRRLETISRLLITPNPTKRCVSCCYTV